MHVFVLLIYFQAIPDDAASGSSCYKDGVQANQCDKGKLPESPSTRYLTKKYSN